MRRLAAAQALGTLRAMEAVPDLAGLLSDPRPEVVLEAHRALLAITGVALPARPRDWLEWWETEGAWRS
jgi:hypothetical protein